MFAALKMRNDVLLTNYLRGPMFAEKFDRRIWSFGFSYLRKA